jgi:hypothetical protein
MAHAVQSYVAHDIQTHVAHFIQSYMAHVVQSYMAHVMQSHMAHGDESCVLLSFALNESQFIYPFDHLNAVEDSTDNHATVRQLSARFLNFCRSAAFALLGCCAALTGSLYQIFRTTFWFHLQGSTSSWIV